MDGPVDDGGLTARFAVLERRLAELSDEREIRDLITGYCYRADSKRDDELLELLTDDAEMSAKTNGAEHASVGRERIRAQITDPNGHHRPDLYGQGMHLLGHNLIVEVDGDAARASSYSLLILKRGDDLVVFSASSNEWQLRRVERRWRIVARRRRPIADEDFAEVLLGLDR